MFDDLSYFYREKKLRRDEKKLRQKQEWQMSNVNGSENFGLVDEKG